jgi:hypothetical protein
MAPIKLGLSELALTKLALSNYHSWLIFAAIASHWVPLSINMKVFVLNLVAFSAMAYDFPL